MKRKLRSLTGTDDPATMFPEDRALQPFCDPPQSFRQYESYYRVGQTAAEIAGNVDWECRHCPQRDAVLIRGSKAAKMLAAIPQKMVLLPTSAERTELTAVDVSPQPWTNFQDSKGDLVSWMPVPPGLRPAIKAAAAKLQLSMPPIAEWELPQGALEVSEESHPVPLLSSIRQSRVGLFRYSSSPRDLAAYVISVRRNWGRPYRVIVLSSTNREAETLKRHIGASRTAYPPDSVGKIYVTTVQKLGRKLSVDAAGRSSYGAGRVIVLATDAAMVGTHAAANALGSLPHLRLYGFLSRDAVPEPYVQHRIDAFFGLKTVDLHATVESTSPCIVIRQKNANQVHVCGNASTLTVKQKCIWGNNKRNELIRLVANYLVGPYAKSCPSINPELREIRTRLSPHCSVLVLVESDQHLGALRVAFGSKWAAATVGSDGELTWQGKVAHESRQVIATFVAAVKLPPFDVVVRADGGPGLPSVPAFKNADGMERRVLIDIWDHGRPPLRQWARSRWEAYQDRGWIERPDREAELINTLISVAEGD